MLGVEKLALTVFPDWLVAFNVKLAKELNENELIPPFTVSVALTVLLPPQVKVLVLIIGAVGVQNVVTAIEQECTTPLISVNETKMVPDEFVGW